MKRNSTNFATIFTIFWYQFFLCDIIKADSGDKTNYIWLNVQYVNCLKNRLPCECEDAAKNYYLIWVDIDSDSKHYGILVREYKILEPYFHKIRKNSTNEYVIVGNDNSEVAKFKIVGDYILLYKFNNVYKFIKTQKMLEYDQNHISVDYVNTLNLNLSRRKIPSIEKIVGYKMLLLDCNRYYEKQNLLSVSGKPPYWILSIENKKIYIDRVVQYPEEQPGDATVVENIASYKWIDVD